MTRNYRTYTIQGYTAFAKGQRMTYPSNNTVKALKRLGVRRIIWGNGDFLYIGG